MPGPGPGFSNKNLPYLIESKTLLNMSINNNTVNTVYSKAFKCIRPGKILRLRIISRISITYMIYYMCICGKYDNVEIKAGVSI